jgi:hypothetical protein
MDGRKVLALADIPSTDGSCYFKLNLIKLIYTNYTGYSIHKLLTILLDKLINYYSRKNDEFKFYRDSTALMKKNAKTIDKKLFILVGDRTYNYKSQECDETYLISIADHLKLSLKGYNSAEFAYNPIRLELKIKSTLQL